MQAGLATHLFSTVCLELLENPGWLCTKIVKIFNKQPRRLPRRSTILRTEKPTYVPNHKIPRQRDFSFIISTHVSQLTTHFKIP